MFESIRMSHLCTLVAWKVWQSTVQPPFSFIGLFLSPMLTAKEARSLSLVRTLSSQYVYVVRCRIRGFLLCVRSPVWSLKCHTTKRTAIIQRQQQRIPPTIKCRPSSAYFRQRKEALSLYDVRLTFDVHSTFVHAYYYQLIGRGHDLTENVSFTSRRPWRSASCLYR